MKKKRILSWLLAIAIVISSLPISALLPAKAVQADETEGYYSMNVTCDESMGGVESSFVMDYYPGMVPPMASVWIYKAYPKSGYHFVRWEMDGVSQSTQRSWQAFVAPQQDGLTVTAVFEEGVGATNLSAKFNHSEEISGDSLTYLIEIFEYFNEQEITFIEIVSGQLTSSDYSALWACCNNSEHDDIGFIIDPAVDTSGSFGENPIVQAVVNLLRFEAEGFTSLSRATLQANATDLPSLWVPYVTQLGSSGSVFANSDVVAVYLPNLTTIADGALQDGSLKHLILPGNMPATVSEAAFDEDPNIKVWVSASNYDTYITVADANPSDGRWYGCEVISYSDSITNLEGLVASLTAEIPELDELSAEDEEAVMLAKEIASALPYASVTGVAQTDTEKIDVSYAQLMQAIAQEITGRINALPAVGEITLENDQETIETLWDDYYALMDSVKIYITQQSVDVLTAAFVRINELKLESYLEGDDAYIAFYNSKFVFSGDTLEDIRPTDLPEDVTITELMRGSFTADELKEFYIGHSLIVDEGVVIEDGILPTGFYDDTANSKRLLELPGIEIVEYHAFTQTDQTPADREFEFILPDVVKIQKEAFYDSMNSYAAPNFSAFMPKLIEANTVLTSENPLILPRLQSGQTTYVYSTEDRVFLPSLEVAGSVMFYSAETQSAWFPSLETIDANAFRDSSITELYLGSTPPVITENAFANIPEDRTVYVPEGAVSVYQTSGDGEKWNGFTVKPISNSTTADDFVNYLIDGLPDNSALTVDYAEWIYSIEEILALLSTEQKASVNISALESAIDRIEELESTDVQNVIDMIGAITSVDLIDLEDQLAIEGARSAYERLTDYSKDDVTNLSTLEAAEAKLNEVMAADIVSRISELPSTITSANKDEVRVVYANFVDLNETARQMVTNQNLLMNLMNEVVRIERNILSANIIDGRISVLPATEDITLAYKGTVSQIRNDYDELSNDIKALVQNLSVLAAAEAKITELSGTTQEKTVYVSIEKFTLGRGYVQTPVPVVVEEGDNVAQIITELLGSGNYENTGTVDNSFYLAAIKDNDQEEVNVPQYILNAIIASAGSLGARENENWLGEFDYYNMSGWMYTVNDVMTNLGSSEYTYELLNDGDVIRWQYTVYGHGADLGFDSQSGGNKLIETANKGALTAQIAIIDSSTQKIAWMTDEDYVQVYEDAIAIATDMESTQAEVDVITQQLADTPQINTVGTVTVIVKDTVPRRQCVTDDKGEPARFRNLYGLGDYQEPFGIILEEVNVPITADMTAFDVAVGVLKSNGYIVESNSRGITSIGPVVSENMDRSVEELGLETVGDQSKWVLSLNNQAIYDSKTYEFHPIDGDTITLEYSVDGGYDVGCYPYAGINFDLAFNVETRKLSVNGEQPRLYFAAGTTEFTYEYEHLCYSTQYPDQKNRFVLLNVNVDGVEYQAGETIPFEAGAFFDQTRTVPSGAGITSYAGYDGRYILRVLKTPAQLTDVIEALPDPESIDTDEERWAYYSDYGALIAECRDDYNVMTEEEKTELTTTTVDKLNASIAKYTESKTSIKNSVKPFHTIIRALPRSTQINKNTLDTYEPQVTSARALFDQYDSYQQQYAIEKAGTLYKQYDYYPNFLECEERVELLILGGGETIGVATDYYEDMIISNNAFNLDLDADEYAYEVVFKDWPRVADNVPIHIDGLLTFDIADPEIFEIVAVDATYTDLGLGGGNKEYDTVKYYLVPKQAGTTTFTVDFDTYGGRVPEMTVHVNDPEETAIEDLDENLTDIYAIDRTTKYDTFYYWEGEEGAPFTFHVNGDDPTVYVYDYLQYNDETGEATKIGYTVDSDGNVTVLLKDGYNGIEVSATYQGQDVTQVYGLKGKVIKYEITNETRPESETYQVGDTISINIVGLDAPVKKMLRIFNPSTTIFRYDAEIPRQFTVQSGGGQYTAGGLEVELTGSGDIIFSNGRIFQDWFGSPLYSETAQGNQGEAAPQAQQEFSTLPDITVHVEENEDYDPYIVGVSLSENVVEAGDTVSLSILTMDTQYIADSHISSGSTTDEIIKAFTTYYTDIPGLNHVTSEEVAGKTELYKLQTVTFTVPEETEAGDYRIFGGYVDVTHGVSWWQRYTRYFESELDDCILTVTEAGLADTQSAAISELEGYADPSDYDLAGQTALTEAIESGTDAINAAMTIEDVNTALSTAKAVIDQIPCQTIPAGLSEMYEDTGAWLSENVTNPSVGSTGGDWSIIGLARSGYPVSDNYYDTYLSNVNTTTSDKDGNLNSNKYTEYSRVILAVTAIGGDVTDIAGYNFLEKLADFDKIKFQGINGPIFALIALDSNNYDIPQVSSVSTQTSRAMLIDYILDAHLDDGGWNLSSTFTGESDPDMTAMALQALAPYYLDKNQFEALGSEYSHNELKAIVDEALDTLSKLQADDGTFGSEFGGGQSSESTSQVIVALTALKIDPIQDARFIKNDNDPIEALMTFYVDGGGFKHLLSGSRDGMATEQGYYALTAYYRFIEGKTSLYDMSDVVFADDNEKADRVIDLINEIGTVTLDSETAINSAITAYNALNSKQKALVTNYATLQSAIAQLSALKIAECERLINAIGTVTLDKEDAIVKARTYYTSLSDDEQKKVNNYDKLSAAEEALKELKTDKPEPTGSTKSVTVTINDVTYEVSEATANSIEKIDALLNPEEGKEGLPQDFSELTEEQVEDILSAYRAYVALTDDEKLFVENYEDFEAALNKLGEEFHYDDESGVDVRGNEVLPWNVKINVQPQTVSEEQLTAIRETLGEEADMMLLCDIHFTDMLDGNEYEPDALVTVRIPVPDSYDGSGTLAVVHIKDDGTYEYIECEVVDGCVEFYASSFSSYGIASFSGNIGEIVPLKNSSNWLWILLGSIAVIGVVILLYIRRQQSINQA